MAKAKSCPYCSGVVQAHEQHLHAVYDKVELPPIKPMATQVEQHAGQCPHCGPSYVAPVPVGMEPSTPFGASIQRLATYLRSTHAISYERLSALLAQVYRVPISEGALVNLLRRVKIRLDHRVAVISNGVSTGAERANQRAWQTTAETLYQDSGRLVPVSGCCLHLTMRMAMPRFTRLTNAFSKKVANLHHAVSLPFMYYNFARIHKTLRVTPALEAGISRHV